MVKPGFGLIGDFQGSALPRIQGAGGLAHPIGSNSGSAPSKLRLGGAFDLFHHRPNAIR